jgi:hypothetical protein
VTVCFHNGGKAVLADDLPVLGSNVIDGLPSRWTVNAFQAFGISQTR